MTRFGTSLLASSIFVIGGLIIDPAAAQPPQAASPYTLSVFATAPGGLSVPDSIAVLGQHVFIGYGDGHAADGSDGLNSQVVEYTADGSVVHIYTVPGHNDGLKLDPVEHQLWALQNEDKNPNLVIIDPDSRQQRFFRFGPTRHGGGYDDIVFLGCKVYISASNPANDPNTGPAIVSATLGNGFVSVAPVVFGNANAIDIPTGVTGPLNLQDPDSMTVDPLGNIVLDSQADHELIIVSHPSEEDQRVLRLPLTSVSPTGAVPVQADDTAFVASSDGFILFADKVLNTVYKLSAPAFAPGSAYTSANSGPFVGTLDVTSGTITPVVTGLGNPGGLVFVNASDDRGEEGDRKDGNRCER